MSYTRLLFKSEVLETIDITIGFSCSAILGNLKYAETTSTQLSKAGLIVKADVCVGSEIFVCFFDILKNKGAFCVIYGYY
jgi:hypothetical protein